MVADFSYRDSNQDGRIDLKETQVEVDLSSM